MAKKAAKAKAKDKPAPAARSSAPRQVERPAAATSIPGDTQEVLDPEDLPANRRKPAAAIRVQAKAVGYYGDKFRRVGDVFDIHDETAFSHKWMKRVSSSTPEKFTGSNAALERAKKGEPVNEEVPEPRGSGSDVLGD